jgi:hypothetical protein
MGISLKPNKLHRQFPIGCRVLVLLIPSLLLLSAASAQKKPLTPSAKVIKTAFVDDAKLRKEYREFVSAKAVQTQENFAQRKIYDQAISTLEQQTKEELSGDSLRGGGGRESILNRAASKRAELTQRYQEAQKKRHSERMALVQQYERKITLAIDQVLTEGGFTEVKALTKESSLQRRRDITDLILQKLN